VKWLGEVPEHWPLLPLWTCFRRTKRIGFQGEQLLSVYREYGVIPKSSRDDNFNKPSDDLSVYQLVIPGDLAINKMKAWQGSVAISEHRGIVSPAYFVYAASHADNSKYLHYLLRSEQYITGYFSISKGIRINQWDLEPELFRRMPLAIPTLPEQSAIATFLDRETAKIDGLVGEQRRLIELLKEKRQAVISHAVTKGLDPNAPLKPSGIEWLGDVPEHWEVKPLRTVANVVRGASPRPAGDPRYFNGDVMPWVTVAEITKDELIDLTGTETQLTKEGADLSKTFPSGTLIYSNSGATLGVPKILRIDACANDGVVAFEKLSQNVDPQFLYHYLASITESIREKVKQGSGQPNLNTDIVKALRFGLPPVHEQQQIVRHIGEVVDRFRSLTAEATRAIDLLQERRTALISAAVTGKIDVRGILDGEAA
jgi:type I restriction enzyme S subunit